MSWRVTRWPRKERTISRPSQAHQPSLLPREPSWLVAVLCTFALAAAFQGTRGIWEPDEGFYSNVAHGMLQTSNYWIPRLNGEAFLDKPPLVYWTISWGQHILGTNEWGARLGHALWFVLTALFVGGLVGDMWGRRLAPSGVLRFSLALGPFLAANILTPDAVLACCVTMMAWSAWRLSSNLQRSEPSGWNGLWLGVSAGLGILSKGPALLVFAFPLFLFLVARHGRGVLRLGPLIALVVGCVPAAAWYISIGHSIPGAAEYMFDNQIRGRLWSDHYRRNGDLFGSVRVYLPVLLAGTLPWTASVLRAGRQAAGRIVRLPSLEDFRLLPVRAPREVFIAMSTLVPLGVFCVARSRLPLYILPIFPILVVLVSKRPLQWTRWQIGIWVVFLLGLKATAGVLPVETDSRRIAEGLSEMGATAETLVVSVEDKRNGLAFYGFQNLKWVRLWGKPYRYFSPPAPVDSFVAAGPLDDRVVFIVRTPMLEELRTRLPAGTFSCTGAVLPGSADSVLDCQSQDDRVASLTGDRTVGAQFDFELEKAKGEARDLPVGSSSDLSVRDADSAIHGYRRLTNRTGDLSMPYAPTLPPGKVPRRPPAMSAEVRR